MTSKETDWDVGICYLCGYECNPCSQTCGVCARNMTMSVLGWNVNPRIPKDLLIDVEQKKLKNVTTDEDKK